MLFFYSLVFLHLSAVCYAYENVNWTDCGSNMSVVRFTQAFASPFPIKLGQNVSLDVGLEVTQSLPTGVVSKLDVRRVVNVLRVFPVQVKLPILCYNGYGSCQKDLCEVFKESKMNCNIISNSSAACDCPFRAGTYRVTELIQQMPSGKGFAGMFVEGNYKFKWTWEEPTGRQLGCIKADVEFCK